MKSLGFWLTYRTTAKTKTWVFLRFFFFVLNLIFFLFLSIVYDLKMFWPLLRHCLLQWFLDFLWFFFHFDLNYFSHHHHHRHRRHTAYNLIKQNYQHHQFEISNSSIDVLVSVLVLIFSIFFFLNLSLNSFFFSECCWNTL